MNFKESFEGQAIAYGERLSDFKIANNLPPVLFEKPDHIAYKAEDSVEFEEILRDFQSLYNFKDLTWTEKDGRSLYVAQLIGHKIVFGMNWRVEYVELMEPRPEKAGQDLWGIDHAEFYFPDLEVAQEVFIHHDIPAEYIPDKHHPRVEVPINHHGQEVKFTNRRIYSVVEEGVRRGNTFMVPPR